jgi:hypothetical protein
VSCGGTNVAKDVDEVCIDKDNLLVTTPAYMCDAPIDKIFEGMKYYYICFRCVSFCCFVLIDFRNSARHPENGEQRAAIGPRERQMDGDSA